MTLNIIVLTPDVIYMSCDHRLTVGPPIREVSNTSNKAVILTYGDWDGLVTYTGIGQWDGVDISTMIARWLAGIDAATPREVADTLAARTGELVEDVRRRARVHLRHTTTLTVFTDRGSEVWVISNFQTADGRVRQTPGQLRTTVQPSRRRRSMALATGATLAFDRSTRTRLERFADDHGDDTLRMRKRIQEINKEVAESDLSTGLVSPECQVISFRRDGSGGVDMGNPSAPAAHHLMYGTDTTELVRSLQATQLGIDPASVQMSILGIGSSNRTRSDSERVCEVRWDTRDALDTPVVEIVHEEFATMSPLGTNGHGHVVGAGRSGPHRPQNIPWLWNGSQCVRLGFEGRAAGIDDSGIVATSWQDGPEEQVGFWVDDAHQPVPVYHGAPGVFAGTAAAVRDVGGDGRAVGLVRSRTEENGFANTRPALFIEGEPPRVLMDMSGPAGAEAMRINVHGQVLVLVLERTGIASWMWDVGTDKRDLLAGAHSGIVATAITDHGVVLGQTTGRERVALIRELHADWRPLGTPPGFVPVDMNNDRTVVGSAQVGQSYTRAWIHTDRGTEWLATVEHHHTSAVRISNAGSVIGFAGSDCAGHPVVWQAD